jgi:hypothetical protein
MHSKETLCRVVANGNASRYITVSKVQMYLWYREIWCVHEPKIIIILFKGEHILQSSY